MAATSSRSPLREKRWGQRWALDKRPSGTGENETPVPECVSLSFKDIWRTRNCETRQYEL